MKQRLRVALVGPVFPYRGGIAQHTTMLAYAIQKIADLLVVSYSRQYPRFLYPGKSDRDPDAPSPDLQDLRYQIDSINPFSWLSAVREIRGNKPDLVILVWWTFFWAPFIWYAARSLKKHGIEVCFFCHNAVEHEGAFWKTWLCRQALAEADSYFVHTSEDALNLRSDFPDARITRHPHPIYDHFPPPTKTLPRRAEMELLFFGLVRSYKGLDVLIEAMALLRDKDVMLSVVGEFWSDREDVDRRIAELDLAERIVVVERYVSDEEAANHFSRADIVVLPYRSATGSGVIPLAYHYDKPVIATKVGGLPDVVDEGNTGWLVAPNSAEQLAAAIRAQCEEPTMGTIAAIGKMKRSLTWESMAAALLMSKEERGSHARLDTDNV